MPPSPSRPSSRTRPTRRGSPGCRTGAPAPRVLEEHQHLAAQDEEDLLDLVGVGGVALAGRDEHDAQREVLGRDRIGILLARGASPDEPMLRAPESLDARVREGVPVRTAIDEPRDLSLQ